MNKKFGGFDAISFARFHYKLQYKPSAYVFRYSNTIVYQPPRHGRVILKGFASQVDCETLDLVLPKTES